jgi:hypothetical protein
MAGDRNNQTFLEALFGELRHAFQDVRQKVVEEGWFGRVVTAKPVIEVHGGSPSDRGIHGTTRADELLPPGPERRSFEELWAPREPSDRDPQHEQAGLDHDR